MRSLSQVIFWSLALAFLATVIALFGGTNFAAIIGLLSPMPALIASLLSVQSRLAFRKRRVAIILSYLEQAVRLNLPLPRFLSAAAASEDALTGRRLIELRDRLEVGPGLSESLDRAVPEASRRTIALIAAGERTGRLPQALDRLVRESHYQPRDLTDRAFFLTYPAAMTVTIIFVIGLIMIFVMPKYQQILKDFGTPMPPVTAMLIYLSYLFASNLPVILLCLILVAMAWLAGALIWPAQDRRYAWLTGWFTRDRDLADVCRVVADGLSVGMPLDAALRQAAELPLSEMMRWRLYRWASGIERGLSAPDSARRAGMPRIVTGLTATAEITQAHETFVFLARYYRSLFRRLQRLARGAALPAMVFFFAAIVTIVALGLFMPIITLMSASTPYKFSL